MFSPPKLVFSLVYLGQVAETHHRYFFQIHHLDPRFLGHRWLAPSGWTVRATSSQEIVFGAKTIFLWDPADSEVNNRRPFIGSIHVDSSMPNAKVALQEALDALREFVDHCPILRDEVQIPLSLSAEVRDSLLDAVPQDEDDDEGPAPIFLDAFDPPRISLS